MAKRERYRAWLVWANSTVSQRQVVKYEFDSPCELLAFEIGLDAGKIPFWEKFDHKPTAEEVLNARTS